jgi:hypothetical protein
MNRLHVCQCHSIRSIVHTNNNLHLLRKFFPSVHQQNIKHPLVKKNTQPEMMYNLITHREEQLLTSRREEEAQKRERRIFIPLWVSSTLVFTTLEKKN